MTPYLFILCLAIRSVLVYVASILKEDELIWIAIPTLLIGVSFWIIYLFRLRMKAMEAGGKEKTFWHHVRPIHGTLYIVFAILAFRKKREAWIVLAIDVMLGFTVWGQKRLLT